MQIHGLNKTTLLDYPEHVAATVFTGGCNFCCPFCHNADLVLHSGTFPTLSEEEVFAFLQKRKNVLTGVCITGGEPTLQPDLPDFIRRVKELGYLVKLDTNGYRPEILKALLEEKLLDYVAMDVKNSKIKYDKTVGKENLDIVRIEESVELLKGGNIPYEFRTTVVKELHAEADFEEIGEWIQGAGNYFLQSYRDNDNVIQKGFTAYTKGEMEAFVEILKKYIKRVELRGVE
ncbi:MAG: anaerobic ribonucleoside-triphosphate reductase activating protein [Lachnospiraceae bacterium]|nr:anaerobic ribonucleoside-triphosphate reductase activating protein [Lachnospiraceae bacterium]MBQ7781088.1 anaerobic ribonucleoside-triphosphate reductase activating protein [Lachnospiraceae bacterium]